MKKKLLLIILSLFSFTSYAQSFELMPGRERVFMDVQYLKFLDGHNRVSLFSRTRATAEYDRYSTDLFTGAYLNYTSNNGLGATVLGRISSNTSGIDIGIHYFKATASFMIYTLPSININDALLYSWFSILRWTPQLSKVWKLYSSLELFFAYDENGNLSSVQRIRIGVDKKGYQFGFAANLSDSRFSDQDVNPGLFIRKQF
ncbi:MAG: hypothetical protein AAGA77_20820 [Bacteroidota bacterium]